MDITRSNEKKNVNPFEICDSFLKSRHNIYLIGGTWREQVEDTLKLMFDCVTKLDKDEKLENFSFEPIEKCINFFNCLVIEKIKDDKLIEFIKAFIFIAYNINENLEKYEPVRNKIAYLQRYCDDALTYSETLNLMTAVSKRISRWKEWTPPSFRLSEHYYNLLKGD